MNLGLALSLARPLAPAGDSYDIAGESFAGWYRASYGGSPWSSTASAGDSGSAANLAEATNPPATGTAVNGFTPADFDGSNDILHGNASSNYVTTGAGTIAVLAYIDAVSLNLSQARSNHGIVAQNGFSFFTMAMSTSGLRCSAFDSAHREVGPVACSTGAWHLLMMRWNGTVLECSVDVGTPASVGCTGPSTLAANIRVGAAGGGAMPAPAGPFCDFKALEVITSKSYLNDATLTQIYQALQSRYGL